MKRFLARTLGFAVMGFGLLLTGLGAVRAYDTLYGGTSYRVVMPNGAPGMDPGGAVNFRGTKVGVVTSSRPLLWSPEEERNDVWRTFHEKRKRLLELSRQKGDRIPAPGVIGPEDAEKDVYPMAGMALVRILLDDEKVPINKNTYAGGSASYMTGQGYVTILNRLQRSTETENTTYIPSFLDQPWQHWYRDIFLRFGKLIDGTAKLQKRFKNWYVERNGTADRGPDGRTRLRRITALLEQQRRGIDSLASTLEKADRSLADFNEGLEQFDRGVRAIQSSVEAPGAKQERTVSRVRKRAKFFTGRGNESTAQLRRTLQSIDRTVRTVEEWIDDFSDRTLRRGVIQNVWN